MWLRRFFAPLTAALLAIGGLALGAEPPNIIWVISEDASTHIGPYGETTIRTPHLDQMAANGVKFENAFVTNPVCSPSRSAIVAGMYQTTLGAHNHRSANTDAKAGGNEAYYDSYRVPESIKLIPELFAEAGYYVVNGGKGKSDYNFISRGELYQGQDWKTRSRDQPFFAQVQLQGGKARGAKISPMTDPAEVTLPPYYPNVPELREDWARYLNSWVKVDNEIGALFDRLKKEGIYEKTIVFFITDHGISHLRGKQFLYDEGTRVPLIVRFPKNRYAGTVRRDLVSHIDVAAASLQLAGIPIPDYVQGRPLFAEDHQPRDFVFTARDRCDETVDTIRAVRDGRYRYIRNFRYFRSHMQPNQYKYGKEITKTMFALHRAGKLNGVQNQVFAPRRPAEELYDLDRDPYETINLAGKPIHARAMRKMRSALYEHMKTTRDMGLVPEPLIEDLGKKYGSKFEAMLSPDQEGLVAELIAIADAGAHAETDKLVAGVDSLRPSVRYWAAIGLANSGAKSNAAALEKLIEDSSPTVRIAAARGLYLLREEASALELLATEIDNPNLVVGLYAIRVLEEIGEPAKAVADAIRKAASNPYDTTRRVARRLIAQYELDS